MSTNYRVLVQFDAEKSLFVARAPELEHCSAEGASRAEAIGKLEDEITAQLANIREQGGRAPAALDSDDGASGELSAKLSRGLHRELLWQARNEGVVLGQLVAEMLAAGLDARRRGGGGRRPHAGPGNVQGQADGNTSSGGNQRDDRGQRRGGGGGGRDQRDGRYHNIMEDRGSFMEYVRSLEQGGGRGGGSGGGGGRGRPGGGGGGGGRRGGAGGSGAGGAGGPGAGGAGGAGPGGSDPGSSGPAGA